MTMLEDSWLNLTKAPHARKPALNQSKANKFSNGHLIFFEILFLTPPMFHYTYYPSLTLLALVDSSIGGAGKFTISPSAFAIANLQDFA